MHVTYGRFLLILISVVLVASGCSPSADKNDSAQAAPKSPAMRVVAVSYALQYLTQRIVGDSIDVELPIPPGEDPQHWRPSREAIASMQSADLIIANGTGATYANWLATVSLPESKMCYSATRGLSLSDYIAVEDVQIVHTHGPEGEHSHATMVARSWLDPAIAKQQAIYIADQLGRVYPKLADQFNQNMKSLTTDLDRLAGQLETLKATSPPVVLSASPDLKFFTRAAGVTDRHLTWFELPSAEQAKSELKTLLSENSGIEPNLILFGSENPDESLKLELKTAGLEPIIIDLIDKKPETGDYLTAMESNIAILSAAMNRK